MVADRGGVIISQKVHFRSPNIAVGIPNGSLPKGHRSGDLFNQGGGALNASNLGDPFEDLTPVPPKHRIPEEVARKQLSSS